MRLRRILLVPMVCALAMLPARAHAGSDPAVQTGDGVKLGDAAILHLSLGVELDYDSNVAYQTKPIGALELRLLPGFDISNSPRGGQRQFLWDVYGALNYLEYLANLTDNENLRPMRQFNVEAGGRVTLFATSPYNVTFFDNYARTSQPPYQILPYDLLRDTNDLGVRVQLSPGGGRLSFYLSYIYGIDYFERKELSDFNLMSHRFDLRASWRFLPKTAVYIDASEGLYLYQTDTTAHPNSYPLRVEAGLQGLITNKLTLNVFAGYGNGFYDHPKATTVTTAPGGTMTATAPYVNPNEVVAGAALTWQPTILSTGTLGYDHDFQNSLLGAYYDMDRVYLSWTQLIWRFTAFVNFTYANDRYKGINIAEQSTTATSRTDNYFTLNLRADYPLQRWLFVSAGYDLQADVTNGKLTETDPATMLPGVVPVNYLRNVVYLRLTLRY